MAIAVLAYSMAVLASPPAHAAEKTKHRPIVFVHGFNSDSNSWNSMVRLAEDPTWGKYSDNEIYKFNYGDRTGFKPNQPSIRDLGGELKSFIDKDVLPHSPDGKVDIVAHSMGGLVARSYITFNGGKEYVKHLVTLGTPNHGTILSALGKAGQDAFFNSTLLGVLDKLCGGSCTDWAKHCGPQCSDMSPSSNFLKDLNRDETPRSSTDSSYPKYITFRSNVGDEPIVNLNSRTPVSTATGVCDGVVFGVDEHGNLVTSAGKTSILNGADENIVSECTGHTELPNDQWIQNKVLDALAQQGDAYTEPRAYTKCDELIGTHGSTERSGGFAAPSGGWVQAHAQFCLEVSKDRKEITPVFRVRGCGHYRFAAHVWYYAPEGYGNGLDRNGVFSCEIYHTDGSIYRPGGASSALGSDQHSIVTNSAMQPARAGELRLNSESVSPGTYTLHAPQLSFWIKQWDEGGLGRGDNWASAQGGDVTVDVRNS
ncbi:alpha/beta fold hydrolase [Streptomyces sp. SID6139]